MSCIRLDPLSRFSSTRSDRFDARRGDYRRRQQVVTGTHTRITYWEDEAGSLDRTCLPFARGYRPVFYSEGHKKRARSEALLG
jgi:hypothetical protein